MTSSFIKTNYPSPEAVPHCLLSFLRPTNPILKFRVQSNNLLLVKQECFPSTLINKVQVTALAVSKNNSQGPETEDRRVFDQKWLCDV